jgi:hypothetical protein
LVEGWGERVEERVAVEVGHAVEVGGAGDGLLGSCLRSGGFDCWGGHFGCV